MITFLFLLSTVATGLAAINLVDKGGLHTRHVAFTAENEILTFGLRKRVPELLAVELLSRSGSGLTKRGNCYGKSCGTNRNKGSKQQSNAPSTASGRTSPTAGAYHRAIFGPAGSNPSTLPALSRSSHQSRGSGTSFSGTSGTPTHISLSQRQSWSSGSSSMTVHTSNSVGGSKSMQRELSIGSDVSTGSKGSTGSKDSKRSRESKESNGSKGSDKSLKNRWTGVSFADWVPRE